MKLNLGSSGAIELYEAASITPGSIVQVQPRVGYEVRVYWGNAAPEDYDDCFVLKKDEWAAFEYDNIWLWSSHDAASVLVAENGRVFRGAAIPVVPFDGAVTFDRTHVRFDSTTDFTFDEAA